MKIREQVGHNKEWYPFEEWNEEQHQLFYQKLKDASRGERSAAILAQARCMVEKKPVNKDLLKAAESLLGFWLMKVNHSPDTSSARDLLCEVYLKLNEPEKALQFNPDR